MITGTQSGLGIRIVGGQRVSSNQELDQGIFIKEVIPGSLAERDGMPRAILASRISKWDYVFGSCRTVETR